MRLNLPGETLKIKTGHKVWLFLLLALVAIFLCSGSAEAADPGTVEGFTDTIIGGFQTAFERYAEDIILPFAHRTFYLLFLIQFAWSIMQLMLHENMGFTTVFTTVTRQILVGMFFYWFLQYPDETVGTIVNTFSALAQAGSGSGPAAAESELSYTKMLREFGLILRTIGRVSFEKDLGATGTVAVAIMGFITSICLSFCLMTAIGYTIIVMVEQYILSSLGLILLGFGGAEATRSYVLNYIKSLVHVGFKLFAVTITTFVGLETFGYAVNLAENQMKATSILQTLSVLTAQSFLFLAIMKSIPDLASALISGATMSGVGGAISGAKSAAGAAAGAAGAVKAPGKAISAVNGLKDAWGDTKKPNGGDDKSKTPQGGGTKTNGSSGERSTAGRIMSMLGHAYMNAATGKTKDGENGKRGWGRKQTPQDSTTKPKDSDANRMDPPDVGDTAPLDSTPSDNPGGSGSAGGGSAQSTGSASAGGGSAQSSGSGSAGGGSAQSAGSSPTGSASKFTGNFDSSYYGSASMGNIPSGSVPGQPSQPGQPGQNAPKSGASSSQNAHESASTAHDSASNSSRTDAVSDYAQQERQERQERQSGSNRSSSSNSAVRDASNTSKTSKAKSSSKSSSNSSKSDTSSHASPVEGYGLREEDLDEYMSQYAEQYRDMPNPEDYGPYER